MVANTHIIQVNPRPYKLEVITYCLNDPAMVRQLLNDGFDKDLIDSLNTALASAG